MQFSQHIKFPGHWGSQNNICMTVPLTAPARGASIGERGGAVAYNDVTVNVGVDAGEGVLAGVDAGEEPGAGVRVDDGGGLDVNVGTYSGDGPIDGAVAIVDVDVGSGASRAAARGVVFDGLAAGVYAFVGFDSGEVPGDGTTVSADTDKPSTRLVIKITSKNWG